MKKYFTFSYCLTFILGGLFWSFLYIILHVVAIGKLIASGSFVLP